MKLQALGNIPIRLDIPPGQQVLYDNRVWTYRGRAADRERRLLFEDAKGLVRDFSDRELLDLQAQRALKLMGPAEVAAFAAGHPGGKPWVVLDACDEDERKRVAWLKAYVRAWELAGKPSRTREVLEPIIAAAAAEQGDRSPPSVRTLQRYIARWVANGRDPESLVRQTENKGNFRKRLPDEQHRLLHDSVDRHYLVQPRPTLPFVFAAVRNDFRKHNEGLPPGERVPMVGRSAVYETMLLVDGYIATCCHRGRREADRRFALVEDGPVTARHNECWEIDHTTADIIVIDTATGLPIGRPILTMAIDRHTRMIMGYHIGWEAPGIQPTIECLRKAISLKDDLLAKAGNLRNPWPAFGIPELLVPDNAKHFKSKDIKEVCLQLGIDVGRTPVLKAWFKGRVERLFRTVAEGLLHLVPGTTFSNVFDRLQEKPPEKVAVCTLAELEALLITFIVDIYNPRRHRTLNTSPLLAWADSVRLHGIRPPPNPADMSSRLALPAWRTVQREGILYEGLWYTSTKMLDILINPRTERAVKIKVDPNDLTRIHFIHPETNTPVEAKIKHSMRPHVVGITLDTHLLARALQRNHPDLIDDEEGLFEAYGMIQRILEEKARGDGLANRTAAAKGLKKLRERAERYHNESVNDLVPPPLEHIGDISADLFGTDEPSAASAGAQPPPQGGDAAEAAAGDGQREGAVTATADQPEASGAQPAAPPEAAASGGAPGPPRHRHGARQPKRSRDEPADTGPPRGEADDDIDLDALTADRATIRSKWDT